MQNLSNIRGRKLLLLAFASAALASCNNASADQESPMTISISSGDVSLSIMEESANEKVGTMKFLPLTEQTISIRFDFVKDLRDGFAFTYKSDLFCIAKPCEENDSTEQSKKLLSNYPYVETKASLHEKLTRITFESDAKNVTEIISDNQIITINGSGKMTFEYDGAAFDPAKHFYACEGLSFMPEGYSLCDDGGKKVGENCAVWYYFSDSDVLKD